MCHFLGQVLGCAFTICWCGQIEISCTTLSGSPCPPNHVQSNNYSMLICCIRLLYDWWYRLYHHITYICYFCCVLSILALIWLVLWRCSLHQRYIVVFHWTASESKSLWESSLCSSQSEQSCHLDSLYSSCNFTSTLLSKFLGTAWSAIIFTMMFHSFLEYLTTSKSVTLFSLSFIFTQRSAGTTKSTIRQGPFLGYYHKVWFSGRQEIFRLYLEISEKFMRLVF